MSQSWQELTIRNILLSFRLVIKEKLKKRYTHNKINFLEYHTVWWYFERIQALLWLVTLLEQLLSILRGNYRCKKLFHHNCLEIFSFPVCQGFFLLPEKQGILMKIDISCIVQCITQVRSWSVDRNCVPMGLCFWLLLVFDLAPFPLRQALPPLTILLLTWYDS